MRKVFRKEQPETRIYFALGAMRKPWLSHRRSAFKGKGTKKINISLAKIEKV